MQEKKRKMKTYEYAKRLAQVVKVLHKNQFGQLLKEIGVMWRLPLYKRYFITHKLPQDLPVKIRKTLEELGGAYIKFGQLLSIRPDLVPSEYCTELSKLLDNVKPDKYEDIIKVIEQDFGKVANTIFSHIEKNPLGSGSVAQVHKARLKNGTPVVIKIQRPNVAQQFETDIAILRYLAQKLQKHIKDYDPVQIVNEFEIYTKKELDFTTEAENIEDIEAHKIKDIIIPKVHWNQTTKRVLTLDYIEGTKLSETKLAPQQKEQIAHKILDATLSYIFDYGTFHADLHPGNIIIKDNKIGLIDFGIVGTIDETIQKLGLKLYTAIIRNDSEEITNVLLTYGEPNHETNLKAFQHDIKKRLRHWQAKPTLITTLMYELFSLCTNYHIKLPPDTILLGKALITTESTAHTLAPKLNLIEYSDNKITKLLKKYKAPQKIIKEYTKQTKNVIEQITNIPKEANILLHNINNNGIQLKDDNFRHIGLDIETSSNRISYALISASSILAASQLTTTGPQIYGYGVLSIAALTVATLFILLLFHSVMKEGKNNDKH